MSETNHGPPIDVDEYDDHECDEVGDNDVCVEKFAGDVTDGQHAEYVAFVALDVLEVVGDIDGDKGASGEDGTGGKKPAHKTHEA